MRSRVARIVAGAARVLASWVVVAAAAACSPEPSADLQPEPLEGWSFVALPAPFVPATVVSADLGVLVGGSTAQRGRPRLAVLADGGSARLIDLQASSVYAKETRLVSLAARGQRVFALGGIRDGAHSNVRWSVWHGTADRLVEHPQGFNTFGGPDAGHLIGVVAGAEGPAIVGSWAGQHGLDAAVWRPDGSRWVREPSTGSGLANSSRHQVSVGAAAYENALVLAGSVLDLENDLVQTAALWTRTSAGQPWRLQRLPDGGPEGTARAVACDGGDCWLAGHTREGLKAWHLAVDGTVAVLDVPGVADLDAAITLVLAEGRPVILTSRDGQTRLDVRGRSGDWRSLTGPAGTAVAAAASDSELFVITEAATGNGLWRCEIGAVLGP